MNKAHKECNYVSSHPKFKKKLKKKIYVNT